MGFHYNAMFSCSNIFLSDSRFLKNGNSKRVQKFHHISFLDLFYWPELFAFRGNTFKRGGGGGDTNPFLFAIINMTVRFLM